MYDICAPSTHRALICQEIVENICEFLDPYCSLQVRRPTEEADKICTRTLAKLACTAKTFSDPALRVLWRRLDGINNLLRVLPQYAPHGPNEASSLELDEVPPRQLIGSEPDDHAWARLQSYAVRVRVLEYWVIWTPVDIASFRILLKRCNGQPLLPRLDRIRLDLNLELTRGSDGVLIPLLVPPTLCSLSLSASHWSMDEHDDIQQYKDMVQDIVSRVPRLRHLFITRSIGGWPCLYPIKALREVQTLSLPDGLPMNGVMLAHCASLPFLRDLSCRVDNLPQVVDIRAAFQNLSRLSLHGSANGISCFLTQISVTNLCDISLLFNEAIDMEDLVHSILESLKLLSPSLRHFAIKLNMGLSEPLPLMQVIEPLLGLRSLETFKAHFRHPISISAEELVRMATAWPNVRMIHISHYGARPGTQRLPAQVLERLAHRCPRLESLKLPLLDFRHLPRQTQEPIMDHGLVHLDFSLPKSSGHSDDSEEQEDTPAQHDDWLNAAIFIDRLFPRLDLRGDGMRGTDTDVDNGRKRLINFLSALRAGREHAEAIDKLRSDGGEDLGSYGLSPILYPI